MASLVFHIVWSNDRATGGGQATNSIFKDDIWNLSLASPLLGLFPTFHPLMPNLPKLVYVGAEWEGLMHVYMNTWEPHFCLYQLIYLSIFPLGAKTDSGLPMSFYSPSLAIECHCWTHSCSVKILNFPTSFAAVPQLSSTSIVLNLSCTLKSPGKH